MRKTYLLCARPRTSIGTAVTAIIPSRLVLQISSIIWAPALTIARIISPGSVLSIAASAAIIAIIIATAVSGPISAIGPIGVFVASV